MSCLFFPAYFSYTTINIFHITFFGEVYHFGIKEALWIDVENEKLQIPGSFVKICHKKQKLKVVAALMNIQTNNMTVCDVVLKDGNLKLAWNFEMLQMFSWYISDLKYISLEPLLLMLVFLNAFFIIFCFCFSLKAQLKMYISSLHSISFKSDQWNDTLSMRDQW